MRTKIRQINGAVRRKFHLQCSNVRPIVKQFVIEDELQRKRKLFHIGAVRYAAEATACKMFESVLANVDARRRAVGVEGNVPRYHFYPQGIDPTVDIWVIVGQPIVVVIIIGKQLIGSRA